MTDVAYDVPLIPQPTKLSCWAASMAMLLSYRRQASFAPESLAAEVGSSLRTSYGWELLDSVKDHFGFVNLDLPSNTSLYETPDQWWTWLTSYGPLWVTTIGAPSHAIVVKGTTGDGAQMLINNPWDTATAFSADEVDFDPPNNGVSYQEPFANLAAEFGNLGLSDYGSWRVLYLPAS